MQSLALAARETAAAVAYVGVVSVFRFHDEIVGVGYAGSLYDLFACGIGNAEGDIVVEGIVEENGLLVDIAHECAQVVYAHILDIGAVDVDASLLYVIEAG